MRCVDIKLGLVIRDCQDLETKVKRTRDLTGRFMRISIKIS